MLTTFDLDEYALAGLQAGASGFLLKDVPPAELLFAIRSVHAGDSVVAPSTTRRLHRPVRAAAARGAVPRRPTWPSSPSASGRSSSRWPPGCPTPRSPTRLFVSEATVKTHVGRILAKLGLRDRVQAVVLAYESGLVKARGSLVLLRRDGRRPRRRTRKPDSRPTRRAGPCP